MAVQHPGAGAKVFFSKAKMFFTRLGHTAFAPGRSRKKKGCQKRVVSGEIMAESGEGKGRFPRDPGANRFQRFWLLLARVRAWSEYVLSI